MEKTNINDELIIKSLNHTKEMADKITKLEFNKPEEAFIASKSIEILKQSTSKLTSKNSLIVPLSFTDDSVAIEVVGNLILETKDSIGRIKKESIEKSTFVLSKTEWNKLSKKLKPEKLSNIKLADYKINYQSKDELIDSFRNSLTQYKNLSNIEGFSKLQQKLQSVKNNSNIEVNDSRKEFNFPGIKFIEDRDSELVKIGPIQSIEIKKEVPGSKKKAKYFGIKMPFVSSAEVDHNGKFFILEMPFVSVLESPKGMIMKLFGFEVVEGNKGKILEDLHRMLNVQAKFENYFQSQMSNMLVVEKNPKFILTKGINEEEPNLLMSGAEDSFYIKQKQDIPLLEQQSEISQETFMSEIKGDIIELSKDEIEVVIEDDDKELATPNLNLSKEEKLNKLAHRIDMMDIDEFIEYMGFQKKKDFLDWLLTLPNESNIRIEGNIIYFK